MGTSSKGTSPSQSAWGNGPSAGSNMKLMSGLRGALKIAIVRKMFAALGVLSGDKVERGWSAKVKDRNHEAGSRSANQTFNH